MIIHVRSTINTQWETADVTNRNYASSNMNSDKTPKRRYSQVSRAIFLVLQPLSSRVLLLMMYRWNIPRQA